MRRNAPHLVHDLAFVVPNYEWWEAPFYSVGLRIYDLLAGKYGFGRSHNLCRAETLQRLWVSQETEWYPAAVTKPLCYEMASWHISDAKYCKIAPISASAYFALSRWGLLLLIMYQACITL